MANNFETAILSEIKGFYEEAFRFYDKTDDIPPIDVRFYPYIGINQTIRLRSGTAYIRIADLCREMPPLGQKALAYILVAKLRRKRVPSKARDIYAKAVTSLEIREKASENRRTRGRKVITTSKGAVYDLDQIFDEINRSYFDGAIKKPVLSWSARNSYHRLGHYSPDHNTIIISRSLDDAGVPRYVVESVMHHEMLHIYHPTKIINGRRYSHTAEFRRDEQKFIDFERSENWIRKNARALKIRAKSTHRPR